MNENDTISAICSGIGGALTVIRISGADALNIGNSIWKSKNKLSIETAGRFMLGKILPNLNNGAGESAFAVFMKAPNTFTGEDIVELHAHGGNYNGKRLLEAVINAGGRQANPGEFTYRAFLNGKMDLTQAEAVADLIASNNDMAVRLAERQMSGVLGTKVTELKDQLLDILIDCEARVDFPDEELDFRPVKEVITVLSKISNEIKKLYDTGRDGIIIRDGVKVVIAGRPNAGKSSLLNLLLGYDRAITTDVPGTTRDTLEELASIRGIPVKLIDTAGIRETEDVVEKIGVSRSLDAVKQSHILLWVLDSSSEEIELELRELERYAVMNVPVIAIWNKADIADRLKIKETSFPTVKISIKEQTGIEDLLDLFEKTVWEGEHQHEPEIAVSLRHAQLLFESYEQIPLAVETISNQDWELAAVNLKAAVSALGNVVGEDATIDIYGTIFSKFCIGK